VPRSIGVGKKKKKKNDSIRMKGEGNKACAFVVPNREKHGRVYYFVGGLENASLVR
jgi:hypothetical protein